MINNITIGKSMKYGMGALAAAGLMALGISSCKKDNACDTGMTKEQIADYIQQAKANNEPILNFYDAKAEQDSIVMVEAMKALKGVDMNQLKQKHDVAVSKRLKAQQQIDAAKKVSTPEVVNQKEKEASEVWKNTKDDINNYDVALKNQRLADGEEYNKSKQSAKNLHRAADAGKVMLNKDGKTISYLESSVVTENGKKVFDGTRIETNPQIGYVIE